jgi:uncharacterized membrane protein
MVTGSHIHHESSTPGGESGETGTVPEAGHSHGHSHAHGPVAPASRHAIIVALAALIPAALITIIGLIVMWPGSADQAEPWTGALHAEGVVIAVREQPCPAADEQGADPAMPPGLPARCGSVLVRLDTGPDAGKQVATEIPGGPGAPVVETGDEIVLIYTENANDPAAGPVYSIMDHERSSGLWALVLAFVLAVVAFGRWRGVRALAGLGFTFAVLLMFIVPAILDGSPPLLVAIVGSSAIMLVVLYLTHGINLPTSMAVLGVLVSLALTGALAAISTNLLHLTGIASDEASFFSMQFGDVNMLGLLLAGILIGALGVLDDVAVTQAYTVTELAQANPSMGFGSLYRAASRIGRAHITSVINTIVLAYAGASLPVLLLLTAGGAPLGEMVTSEWLTQEIVRSIVGTLGLIAAVPITTALAALNARHTKPKARKRTVPSHRKRPDPLEAAWGLEQRTGDWNQEPRH